MKHITALLIKLVFIEAIVFTIIGPVSNPPSQFGSVFAVGLLNTILLYALGDMTVLPAMGNWAATIGDGGLALLITWLAPLYAGLEISFFAALLTALAISIAEYFYHGYLERAILPGSPVSGTNNQEE